MAAVVTTTPGEYVPTADQRLVRYNVPWEHYEVYLALRGEKSTPRITFLDGALEIMSPSRDHERIKWYIGRLIEAYALDHDIEFSGYGSWTLKSGPKEAGLEPDECYIIGDQNRDVPNLAIEVIWTSGGIEKLEIYRRLGVAEVWTWKDSRITIRALQGDAYRDVERSQWFPDLDVALVAAHLHHPSFNKAVRAFRDALRLTG